MNGNPFYVSPMLAESNPGQSFLRGMQIGEVMRQRQAQKAQAQRITEGRQAIQQAKGDPSKVWEVLTQYPEIADEAMAMTNWYNDQSKNLHLKASQQLSQIQDMDDAINIQRQRVRTLEGMGADASHSRADLEKMVNGEFTIDDVRASARTELLAHPEGRDFMKAMSERQKPMSEAGKLAYDMMSLPEDSPLRPRFMEMLEMKAREAGGDTAAIKNYKQWVDLNQESLQALQPGEARREMARAFNRIVTPPQLVATGGGGYAVVDRLGGGRSDVVSPEEATEREARLAGEKSTATAAGSAEGEKTASAPEDLVRVEQFIDVLDRAIEHPGREAATGKSSILNPVAIPGSERKDYLVLAEQMSGKNFLDAYQSLKGGGTITEIEGQRAEAAQARLNRAQSEQEYLSALIEMRDMLMDRKRRIESRLPDNRRGDVGIDELVNQYAD